MPHLFDTYTLVNRLTPAYAQGQSIGLMYLIHHLLHQQLSTVQSTLLSRSTLENDAYLFRAASAELRSEISTLRATQLEKMRSERAQVQREFELLNGRFMEELMVCGNELRGMFNDRKMVTREEQREVENKIQELNYKITVSMGSDLKSEVEKLRWVTTRRGLIAIGILAGMRVFFFLGGEFFHTPTLYHSLDPFFNILSINIIAAFIVSLIKLSQAAHRREKEKEKELEKLHAQQYNNGHSLPLEHGNGHNIHLGGVLGPKGTPVDGPVHITTSVGLS